MHAHELKPFRDALLPAFDAIGARPPGEQGIETWFRALRAYPLGTVVGAIDDWVMRNRRAPTPSDIADACRAAEARRDEQQREQWKAEEHNAPYVMGRTETGRRALEQVRELVSRMKRPGSGLQRDWAHRAIDRYVDHDPALAPIAFDFACDALGKTAEERAELRAVRDANSRRRAA
ncbi:MAG TPA: hypothetical protein VEA81_00235 [Burkholderiaceae bacterium]|nr:hypothetical protein [Burkholderiaceae bacterium]